MAVATTTTDYIHQARALLSEGKNKKASRALTDAAVTCRDPEQAAEIKTIAEEGLQSAGMLGKGQWKEVLRLASLRGAK